MSSQYHEGELIRLTASRPWTLGELHELLVSRAFSFEDDFYFLDRPDDAAPWQSISVITINVFHQGVAVAQVGTDAGASTSWDAIEVEYLMATLPAIFIEQCALECEALAAAFDLTIGFEHVTLDAGMLKHALQVIADRLTTEFDAPGSESLAILIAMSYN